MKPIGAMPQRMRRSLAAISAVVVLALATVALWPGPAKPKDLLLLYVGAEDCAPCRAWQKGEGAQFRAAPEFERMPYREVKSATLRDVLKDENWPEDLRGYRDQLGAGVGVPMWLVIADSRIVNRSFGESQWRTTTLPKIKSLLR
jgi:hypothetical protein